MRTETAEKLRRKHKCQFTKRLRHRMTQAEKILWQELRNRKLSKLKFYRQVNIGPYIVDFLCKQHRIVVEVDGGIHKEQREYDRERDEWLLEENYRVLHVKLRQLTQAVSSTTLRASQGETRP